MPSVLTCAARLFARWARGVWAKDLHPLSCRSPCRAWHIGHKVLVRKPRDTHPRYLPRLSVRLGLSVHVPVGKSLKTLSPHPMLPCHRGRWSGCRRRLDFCGWTRMCPPQWPAARPTRSRRARRCPSVFTQTCLAVICNPLSVCCWFVVWPSWLRCMHMELTGSAASLRSHPA